MAKRIVIALGGNALGNTLHEQFGAAQNTARAIADLIQEGHQVVVAHGNGPQVGMINLAMSQLTSRWPEKYPPTPLTVCGAMSQGYIGYDLQNTLREELLSRGIHKEIATLITQVAVDPEDPAFRQPTKPIGRFMSHEEAKQFERQGYAIMEDSGRGWRRVVASPRPQEIIEMGAIRAMVEDGHVVIACGGGGIPVIHQGNRLKGVPAVIDKDFASCCMAKALDADYLIILTAVEKVAIYFGKPNQEWLSQLSTEKARELMAQGHFAPGSMLPKVQAAVEFAQSKPGRSALITLLEKAREGILGLTGTLIRD
ncbi:MAG: carbamate kinase [Peptococcaceae bacterium]|nr:carbamate kinase [Peptococcaceae bacterium]